ncbi:MAG TPA: ribosomal protein L7/L12 [Polyangiaceae bacterium]|jgi:ribosomal protein L7/L12
MKTPEMLHRLKLASAMLHTAYYASVANHGIDGPEEEVFDEGLKIVDEVVEALRKRLYRINDRLVAKAAEKIADAPNAEPPEQDKMAEVLALAKVPGQKIEAIKLCRELTGMGLKESREHVESLLAAKGGDA